MKTSDVTYHEATGGDDHLFLKLILAIAIAAMLFALAIGVYASQSNNVTICHKNNGNGWSQITVDESAVNGQGNGDHNDSGHQNGQDIIPPGSWDSNGRNWTAGNIAIYNNGCNAIVPTNTPVPPTATPIPPTVTPYPTEVIPSPTDIPQPTINPCDGDCITPTQEPTKTPEPTREPEITQPPQGLTHTEGNSGTGLVDNSCHDLSVPEMPQDLWYTDYKKMPENNGLYQLNLHWGTNSNYDRVNVAYGENINQWTHADNGAPNTGVDTIRFLKPRQSYWFQVAYVRGCAVGDFSHPVDP